MGWPTERIIDMSTTQYPKSILSVQVALAAAAVSDIETMVETATGEDYPSGVVGAWVQFSADVRVTFDGVTDPTSNTGLVIEAGKIMGLDSDLAWVKQMKIYSLSGSTVAEIELLG